jgi:hypothetical protein
MRRVWKEPALVKEYDIFVPLFYNDGRPVEAEKFQTLQFSIAAQRHRTRSTSTLCWLI